MCDKATHRLFCHSTWGVRPGVSLRADQRGPPGFSLIELVIVLAVTMVLTGLLLPVLSQVRDNAHRVISASNLRQIGLAIVMYARDEGDRLPYSELLRMDEPLELMAVHMGDGVGRWDGHGRLFAQGYCSCAETYYCLSNMGEHRFERYQHDWRLDYDGDHRIYTNYHYSGDVEWSNHNKRRKLDDGNRIILATDGFREMSDLNHENGMNILRGDGSVRWLGNNQQFIMMRIAAGEGSEDDLIQLWESLEKTRP